MIDGHVSTKDRPGDYDAIETAKPDEPIFTVQGGDPIGASTVCYWADQARKLAGKTDDPKEKERLLHKAKMAEQVAWAMDDYRNGVEEVPAESLTAISDAANINSADRLKERQALIQGVSVLHNALATINDLADVINGLDVHPEVVERLRHDVESLRLSAEAIEPRRGSERS